MSGDYTRFTFDPAKRFAGVQMQQGRVQLDSDWNEEGDLQRERTRLLTLDAWGSAWVAWWTTPDAFLVGTLAGPPADLSLEEGRIYVQGRLAEILPGEGVTYLHQPFLPTPAPLNPGVDTLVYLDLWEREVTWAEDTELLDVALGGVDTTTRLQQVWQVKLHEMPGVPATCGVDLDALFPASGGRLTTSAIAPPAPDDPCILPPNAGYRGIENRLYRIEVQVGGSMANARFKWSRDNGSIVSRVSALAVAGGQTRITVNRIGRDEVLRFRIGDWITLTDDHRELNGEAGQMGRIVDIDEAARVVTIDRAVPDGGTRAFAASAADMAARNTRLQRWDQSAPRNALDANGLMSVGAGPIELEDGVLASFSLAPGGTFHVGDYWVFAARTANASVEELNAAPPRGIRHQYLQLAALPAVGAPHDCRPPPPRDEGCCTVVVHPGEDIQAAINSLPPAGGCICLKAGLHEIDAPLLLAADNVTMHGESLGAIVVNRRGTGVLALRGGEHDRIEMITLRQNGEGGAPVVLLEGVEDCAIADCRIETGGDGGGLGMMAVSSRGIVISGCALGRPSIGMWFDKRCAEVSIAGCTFAMAKNSPNLPASVAILAREMSGFITVEDCTIEGAINGIIVDDDPAGTPFSLARLSRIAGNRLVMAAGPQQQTVSYGIDIAASEALVEANHIVHRGGNFRAIRLCGNDSRASGNVILAESEAASAAVAIVAGHDNAANSLLISQVSITGNIAEGRQNGIVLANVQESDISGNLLGRRGGPLALIGIALNNCEDCTVADNRIAPTAVGILALSGARNRITGNRIDGGAIGIASGLEQAVTISGCAINGARTMGVIALGISQRCTIIENRVIACGSGAATAVGIGGLLIMGEWHVEANEVMNTGLSPDGAGAQAAIAYGISGDLILEARIESNLVTYSGMDLRPVAGEDRALRLRGLLEYRIDLAAGPVVLGAAAQVVDNKFIGPGASALVELFEAQINDNVFIRFERAMFTGNFCSHFTGQPGGEAATVHLTGRALTVANNQVKATFRSFPSWHLHNRRGPFNGNVSHGPTLGRAAANQFPAPENAFNLIV